MAKKNAIVKNLPSVEVLGCTNVICADKTGTLTTNQMSVARFLVINGGETQEFLVDGTTFAPTGKITCVASSFRASTDADSTLRSEQGHAVDPTALTAPPVVRLAQICSLCNDSKISLSEVRLYHPSQPDTTDTYEQETGTYANIGEPTEAALKVLVEKIQSPDAAFNASLAKLSTANRVTAVNDFIESRSTRLLTFEFSRDRKSMSVLVKDTANVATLLVKGAPESVLDRCLFIQTGATTRKPLTNALRAELDAKVLAYGAKGLRTLAFAYLNDVDSDAEHYKTDSSAKYINFEQNLTFVGLIGMLDPPRPEVAGAIAKCVSAGIRVICITGDNKNTAETICRQIGIFGPEEKLEGKSYTGREFDALSQSEKVQAVLRASLFSRTEPGHKLQIVDLLQNEGLVVAMVRPALSTSSTCTDRMIHRLEME